MVKFYYPPLRQLSFLLVLAFVLTAFSTTFVFAQRTPQFHEGILRIKVSESLARELERASQSKTTDNIVLTGVSSIDNVNRRYKASVFRRVFRSAGRFEAKHRRYGLHRWFEIEIDQSASIPEVLSAYKAVERVELSEPVYKKAIIGSENPNYGPVVVNPKAVSGMATLPGASNDPLVGAQWHYNNTGQTGGTPGADIKLFQAWGIETGRSDVIVAVTDGGIQVNHPDLAANMWVNTDEIPGNNIDDDNNGYVDDINGYGFGDDTGTIAPDPHGTHVGGTVAAVTNNGVGVAGVAGGSGTGDGVRLMSCAAFGANATGGFADTYVYAADNGALISQNSWGYTFADVFEQAVLDGIDYFIAEAGKDENGNQVGLMNGGIVIFAAGNSNSNANWYPGFYANTLAVAGTNHQDKKAWYSNFGPWVDVAAPGGETTGVPAQQGVLSTLSNNQYGYIQGTSMACPHVSGLAALLISKYGGPGLTPAALRTRIVETTDDIDAINPTYAGLLGSGRINAFKALQEDDGVAPVAIADLAVDAVGITSVSLTWTSPEDEGSGSATTYDIRYSELPITAANFDSATPVANPPVPQPAGSTEHFTVTGLDPGTTYYFAVRSADFFGNTSALSNVISQATNFAPSIAVYPDTISATLQTAQTTTRPLTIVNSGQGPLTFSFAPGGPDNFATPSPSTGTVGAGDSLVVSVLLDANGLLAGTYSQLLPLLTNDPLRDTLIVPIVLQVINNGAPIASIEPQSLDFGQVFEGASKSLPLTLHNAGSDTLRVDQLAVEPSSFTASASSLVVAPFADAVITVTFQANTLGVSSGSLAVYTNDPADSVLTVALTAEGVAAPNIVVSPDSLLETLNTGQTSTRVLTVSNTGSNALEYSVKVSSGTSRVSFIKELPLSSSAGPVLYTANQKQVRNPKISSSPSVRLKSVGTSAVTSKVLVLTPDNDASDIADILDGFDDIDAVIYPKASLPDITLADLAGYDIVFLTNNTQWQESGAVDPVVIGDLLADYVDAGGKVIVNQFAYSYDAWKLSGRFITGQYGPFTPSTTDANIDTSLGTILVPGHPILEGVSELDYSGFVQNVGLAPGATALANWANGELFLAVNSNVVALNALPSLGNGDPLQWTGDLPTLYQNAVHWLSGPSFVKVDPTEGTVAPGGQASLTVTFDATGLSGGVYTASIDILTNVPGKELVPVPTVLTVLGPAFTVTPDSLNEELEKGETSTRTLVLKNAGTGDYDYAITIANKGVSGISSKRISAISKASAQRIESVKRESAFTGKSNDLLSQQWIPTSNGANLRSGTSVGQNAVTLYETDFEDFTPGDIDGQNGWEAQFGNWTIESENASSGSQHFRGLADGLGQSLAFSPVVEIGTDPKSTTTLKLNIQGTGVTWQIIPQSPTAQLVNTRFSFAANGSIQALVSDGAGGASYVTIPATVPSGYFDLTIEVDRASFVFDVYFNDNKVFTGQGFTGDIEQVVVLSLMEEEGPTLDIDDLKILDGVNEFTPPYLTVSPLAGHLSAGESVEITVGFDATELAFGTYRSDIKIDIAGGIETLVVPATLAVTGDVALEIDQTVLQATVGYKEDTTKHFAIKNTGGGVLNYSLQVIGADTDAKTLKTGPVSRFSSQSEAKRIAQKEDKDNQLTPSTAQQTPILQLLAGSPIFEERFEGGTFPPSGWSVVDHEGNGVVWGFASSFGEGNYSGTGEAATASSDAVGSADFDTELLTPYITTTGYSNVALQFNANYQNYAGLDFLDLDIRVQGDTSWVNILHWNEDHGTLRGTGQTVTVELDEYLEDATSFQLRWHYYDPNPDDYDWYAQVDNIVVLGDAKAWLTVSPSAGAVPVRGTADITARFDSKDLAPGFYVAGILVSSNAVKNPLVGIVASLDVQEPAEISVEPEALAETVVSGLTKTQTLSVSNSGESLLRFSFEGAATPGPSKETKPRIPNQEKRTVPSVSTLKLDDATALVTSKVQPLAATELYATSFEEFSPGDVAGQEGWQGQFGNWTIESETPFLGAQHLRGLSDGLGQSLAFSPVVTIGVDSISSTTLKINADEAAGVTWQVIPQSPTAQLVNTRVQIGLDGSLQVLVKDSAGAATYVPVDVTLPEGYFELRIDVVRTTADFTLYIDGTAVFTGSGFAGNIEQVVILSAMEADGPFLDIDNVAILDGAPQAPWLLLSPLSGTVSSGASLPITVTFDARELAGGVYYDTLSIASNDPANAILAVPVRLDVIPPPVIEVAPDTLHQELQAGTSGDQTLTIHNAGVASLQFTFLGYAGDSTQRNDVSKIYPDTYEVLKGQVDAREGHPVQFGHGGPDKNGYSWVDSNEANGPSFAWSDIAAIGTPLTLDDDDSVSVNLPFSFTFYGDIKNRVTIGSNGYLVFGSNGKDYSNDEIPNAASPNNFIAPLWDDFNPEEEGSSIYYYGDSSKFVVQYTNVPAFLSTVVNTFQVVLYPDGSIQYHYLDVDEARRSATTGIENPDGSIGLLVAFNAAYVADSLTVTITPVPSWILPQPSTGTVAGGSSESVTIQFNAGTLAAGTYRGNLFISSNDLKTPLVNVPVSLTVIDNYAPVLGAVRDTTVVENSSLKLTFTATDADDSVVTIHLKNAPAFVSVVSEANGVSSYLVKPGIGQAGDYDITVVAQDGRGKVDSAIFRLKVWPYGVTSFSLIDVTTGGVVFNFKDTLILDVADPAFLKYTIGVNTNPRQVGSVQFSIDGKVKSVANNVPYRLNRWELLLLSKGPHVLKAASFTKSGARGVQGQSKTVVINVINSAAVTGFQVVNTSGKVLSDLTNGSIINLKAPGFKNITVKANTSNSGVGSVRFDLNGKFFRLDNLAPFSLTGDLFGCFLPWNVSPGRYTLVATPYSQPFGLGIAGEPVTVVFDVIKSTTVAGKGSGQQRSADESAVAEVELETRSFSVYPVPVQDQLTLRLQGATDGKAEVSIRNVQGQLVYKVTVPTQALTSYSINTNDIALIRGVYYLQVKGDGGLLEIRKFIKE